MKKGRILSARAIIIALLLIVSSVAVQAAMFCSSGNVGIGTNSPLMTLHVNGSGATGGFLVTDGSGYTAFLVNAAQGRVGIGTASPQVKMDVAGTLRIGNDGEACGASTEGSIRYNTSAKNLEYCDGTAWCPISGCPPPTGYQIFPTSGSYTFSVPSGVTSVRVVAVGGGGGGGGG
ncbi:TPA: hypothetical protein HA295_01140, partial [Candidatus Woesearchaeota archaeon]|nr:hypothetical protein [Candidatus Woesearchaeota archaeon]